MIREMALQVYLFGLWTYEKALSYLFFFLLRNALLRLMGNQVAWSAAIHRSVKVFSFRGMHVGENSVINRGVYLDGRRGIWVGKNVNIAHDVKIYTLGHDVDSGDFRSSGDKVVIRDNVCIFAGAMVMPGVEIGEGAVVYPGAVVVKSVRPFEIVGGNPARVIRMRQPRINYCLNYRTWFGH